MRDFSPGPAVGTVKASQNTMIYGMFIASAGAGFCQEKTVCQRWNRGTYCYLLDLDS